MPHVQHDYSSPFNQWDHCFLASSSPFLKFPNKLSIHPSLPRKQQQVLSTIAKGPLNVKDQISNNHSHQRSICEYWTIGTNWINTNTNGVYLWVLDNPLHRALKFSDLNGPWAQDSVIGGAEHWVRELVQFTLFSHNWNGVSLRKSLFLQVLSCSWMLLNSSIQHSPPSAKTKAPASNCHSPESLTAATVSPALVEPMPVVRTERGMILAAYLRNCDFPVPEYKIKVSNVRIWRTSHLFLAICNLGGMWWSLA